MKTDPEPTYTCDICIGTKFGSLKELTAHYEKEHPELMEELMIPI